MIKAVVVGLGHIGRRHATIIHERRDMQLAAIVDTDSSKQDNPWSQSGTPFFSRLEDFLGSGLSIDLAIIATPNGYHAEQAIACVRAGCNVVIEKPMALDKKDCEDIIFESLQHSKTVFVVKQNRYSPPSKWLKNLVEQNALGKIYQVHINCFWNRDKSYYDQSDWRGTLSLDGGPLFTQFSHFTDLLFWLFGEIREIKATFANHNHQSFTEFEDSGVVTFRLLENALGSIHFTTSAYSGNLESSITIMAGKGSVKIGGQYMNQIEYCNIEGVEKPLLSEVNPPNRYGKYTGSAANHHFVYENVINTLEGRETVSTNAIEGMKVVEMIQDIYQSGNRKKVLKSLKPKKA